MKYGILFLGLILKNSVHNKRKNVISYYLKYWIIHFSIEISVLVFSTNENKMKVLKSKYHTNFISKTIIKNRTISKNIYVITEILPEVCTGNFWSSIKLDSTEEFSGKHFFLIYLWSSNLLNLGLFIIFFEFSPGAFIFLSRSVWSSFVTLGFSFFVIKILTCSFFKCDKNVINFFFFPMSLVSIFSKDWEPACLLLVADYYCQHLHPITMIQLLNPYWSFSKTLVFLKFNLALDQLLTVQMPQKVLMIWDTNQSLV